MRPPAVTPPVAPRERCQGCGYRVPAASLTVTTVRGHRFQWCAACERDRYHNPEEIVISPERS